jgi:DNA mismatch repair protein MutS2
MTYNLLSCHSKDLFSQFDWEKIESLLYQFTHFEQNITFLSSLSFHSVASEISNDYDYIDKYSELIDDEEALIDYKIINPSEELKSVIKKLSKGSTLDLVEINELVIIFEFYCKHHKKLSKIYGPLIEDNDFRFITKEIIRKLRLFVSQDGEIEYNKHPQLKVISNEIDSTEGRIRKELDKIQKSDDYQKALRYQSFDIVNDRYVLPIRSDSYRATLGEIVGRSDSGLTLYVEPTIIKSLSELRFQKILERQEILEQICRDFCEKIKSKILILHSSYEAILSLDLYFSRIKFHQKYNLKRPDISSTNQIEYSNLKHLLVEDCVENSFSLDNNFSGMCISGPNTGGKSVLLKSTIISQLLFQKGFYVPASYAKLSPFKEIFFHANDNQNISSGLSSFSAEVDYFNDVYMNASCSSLIMSDEVFNSTSSNEASVLTYFLFQKIIEQNNGVKLIFSSHHDILKNLIFADDNYLSAHMDFRVKNNKPTYKLITGSPGSSYALNIFSQYFDKKNAATIISKCYEYLNKNQLDINSLLNRVNEKESQLVELQSQLNNLQIELEAKEKAITGLFELKEKELKQRYYELENKYKVKAEKLLGSIKRGEIKNKNKALDKITIEKESEDFSEGLSPATQLEINEFYFCNVMNNKVQLKEVKDNNAFVLFGKIKSKVPTHSLFNLKNKIKPKETVIVSVNKGEASSITHDCRGMLLADFQVYIDQVLSELTLEEIPYLEIIHGHGDGVLKRWLRDHLRRNKWFKIEENQGNDGATIIKLNQ